MQLRTVSDLPIPAALSSLKQKGVILISMTKIYLESKDNLSNRIIYFRNNKSSQVQLKVMINNLVDNNC